MNDSTPTQRIVPGAPPPAPLSKSQKKKRKSVLKPKVAEAPTDPTLTSPDAKMPAVVEKTADEEEIKKSAVAEELVVQPEQVQEAAPDKSKKLSPAIELLNKRIKAQTKKLSRIAVYSSKPSSELNEDQLKSLSTLPSIQGAVRELEETRKALETMEAEQAKEQAKELARQRAEEENAITERIAQAVSDNTHLSRRRLSQILTLLRLSSLLSDADPTACALAIDEKERQAVYATAAILMGSETPRKEEVGNGLLLGDGELNNITYGRLLEIVELHRNPTTEREPTPTPEADPNDVPTEQETNDSATAEPTTEPTTPAAGDSVLHVSASGSFHFMQESELEATPFEHGAEWVEKPGESEIAATVSAAQTLDPPGASDTGIPPEVNGLSQRAEESPPSAVSAALDWAADDGDGLPSINSLHAKFGTPGDVTPEATPQDIPASTPPSAAEPEWGTQTGTWEETPTGPVDGNTRESAPNWGGTRSGDGQVDEEGFVKARSSRGRYSEQRSEFRGSEQRGRGRGGFRGDRGGEFRSGYRGRGSGGDSSGNSWRGGDGEFKGRGGFRGDRGRGGEFRGRGGRGGEFRGRGRSDRGHRGGRGGFDGNEQGEKQPNS